jgi:hypothetical protein
MSAARPAALYMLKDGKPGRFTPFALLLRRNFASGTGGDFSAIFSKLSF